MGFWGDFLWIFSQQVNNKAIIDVWDLWVEFRMRGGYPVFWRWIYPLDHLTKIRVEYGQGC
jgi:hypothetical protein